MAEPCSLVRSCFCLLPYPFPGVTFAGRNKRSAMRRIRDGRKKGQHQLALYVSRTGIAL
jgi:hypothetical protein